LSASPDEPPINPPALLTADHEVSSFTSSEPTLDDWLKRRAMKSQTSGAARTYVVTSDKLVVGYYSLAVGSVSRSVSVSRVRRNMPEPIPIMLLARLAIDIDWQGRGLGRSLLRDAVLRTIQAAEIVGIRALLVHAISDDAKRFYQYFGFQPSEIESMTLMARLSDLRNALDV
jgi:GNAT superfamily N-acetyltransferase